MLNNRLRLEESPVVNECLNNNRVQARTRESTKDEKESATFLEMAPGAYTTEDLVHDVRDPKLWAAFCSTCAALADASAALLKTDASICGLSLEAAGGVGNEVRSEGGVGDDDDVDVDVCCAVSDEKCSPTLGNNGMAPLLSSSGFRMSKEGKEQMTS